MRSKVRPGQTRQESSSTQEIRVLAVLRGNQAVIDVRGLRRIRRIASGNIIAELVPARIAAKIVATATKCSLDGSPILEALKYVATADKEVA